MSEQPSVSEVKRVFPKARDVCGCYYAELSKLVTAGEDKPKARWGEEYETIKPSRMIREWQVGFGPRSGLAVVFIE